MKNLSILRVLYFIISLFIVVTGAWFCWAYFQKGALLWAAGFFPFWKLALMAAAWMISSFLAAFITALLSGPKKEDISILFALIWVLPFLAATIYPWLIGSYDIVSIFIRFIWSFVSLVCGIWVFIMTSMINNGK